MKIGIVIAVMDEFKAFLKSDYKVEKIECDYREVYKTIVQDNELYSIKSGWGIIDAANATQYLITKYGVNVVLNFGVTGALIKGLKVSDLFVVSNVVNHDYDVSLIDDVKPHQYEEFEDIYMPLDKDLISLAKKIRPDLKDANVASGNVFIEGNNKKDELASLGCSICDMELAAIARTCFLNKVKCLSIKCISDTYEGGAGDYQSNVSSSAAKAFDVLQKIIVKI